MEVVGIRALKTRLSAHIRRAASGETIVITDRGKEVARLVPAGVTDGLRELMERGVVKWSGTPLDLSGITPIEITGEPLSKTVLDDRGPR